MKRETTVDISKHKDLKEFVTQVRNQKEDAEVIQGLITPKANRERGRGWLPELRTLGGGGGSQETGAGFLRNYIACVQTLNALRPLGRGQTLMGAHSPVEVALMTQSTRPSG